MKKRRTNTNKATGQLPQTKKKRAIILLVVGLLAIALGIFLLARIRFLKKPSSLGVVDSGVLVNIPEDELPEGVLYITHDRRVYDGDMRLLIPALDLETPIGTSTEPDSLEEMPGLYEFSQMPDEVEGNVSIAGHRDIHGMEFLDLHVLGEGDLLYLVYQGNVYRYRFRESKIVGPSDWEVIKKQGYTCLTLTTCDPVGTALRRLIVTAELQDIQPYTSDFSFTAKAG